MSQDNSKPRDMGTSELLEQFRKATGDVEFYESHNTSAGKDSYIKQEKTKDEILRRLKLVEEMEKP